MAGLSGTVTSIVVSMLRSTTEGVNVRVGAMEYADSSLRVAGIRTIVALNASVEISEKTGLRHGSEQLTKLLRPCDGVAFLPIRIGKFGLTDPRPARKPAPIPATRLFGSALGLFSDPRRR